MILGLIAGRWLRESAPRIPLKKLLVAGVITLAAGLLLHFTHICPIVKRIWTPSWTLFSGGICFLYLAAFSWVIDVKGQRKWAFPLVVIGMNSIVAYCIAHFLERFITSSFRINLGPNFFAFLGTGLQPLMEGIAVLLCYWLVLLWMYRRKLFLKI
jgi:heparan-alpha-glucosaminide N-acetyltransferase